MYSCRPYSEDKTEVEVTLNFNSSNKLSDITATINSNDKG